MLRLIDVNCRIGAGPADREGSIRTKEALLSLMDDFHVEKAVVFHTVSQYSDAVLGNELLLQETENDPRFLRQWAVQPALWELYPRPDEWLAQMKENGVCSVRLFPKQYGHSLRRYACGDLLDALAECRVPAFISLDQLASWDALYDLCQDYPANRFVLCSPGYRCLRYLVPILESCSNLFVETSNLLMHDGLSDLCRHGLGGRLLFGSGAPEASLAAAASQLLLSDLAEEEKQIIAANNAEKLLSEVAL
ncbi:MAG: amidohydrolase family protein [Clostridia bacterium]|nr:amidohydrolase family protein [Clostridia bacterium]